MEVRSSVVVVDWEERTLELVEWSQVEETQEVEEIKQEVKWLGRVEKSPLEEVLRLVEGNQMPGALEEEMSLVERKLVEGDLMDQ